LTIAVVPTPAHNRNNTSEKPHIDQNDRRQAKGLERRKKEKVIKEKLKVKHRKRHRKATNPKKVTRSGGQSSRINPNETKKLNRESRLKTKQKGTQTNGSPTRSITVSNNSRSNLQLDTIEQRAREHRANRSKEKQIPIEPIHGY